MNIGMWIFTGLEVVVLCLITFLVYGAATDPAGEGAIPAMLFIGIGIVATFVCALGFIVSWLI